MAASANHSVTQWLVELKAGNEGAAQNLWERYYQQLVQFARSRLPDGQRRPADEDDVAQCAFASFCLRAMAGKFPKLHDRKGLWTLLLALTARKAIDLVNHENRQKRRGEGESGIVGLDDNEELQVAIEQIPGPEPTPDFALQTAEECERLLQLLGDESLRKVAVWKMEGYTNKEIAAKLPCIPRTVERKLSTIREIWTKSIDQ